MVMVCGIGVFFFSSRRRHTIFKCDWSSDVCSSDLPWRQREVIRVLRSVQRTALGIGLGIVVLFATYPQALLSRVAFFTETLSPSSTASELQNPTWDYPLRNFLGAFGYEPWPYVYGIGTTSLGTQYVARIFGAKPPVIGVESGFGTLVI